MVQRLNPEKFKIKDNPPSLPTLLKLRRSKKATEDKERSKIKDQQDCMTKN